MKFIALICLLPLMGGAQPTIKTVEIGSFADGRKITALEFSLDADIVEPNTDLSRQEVLFVLTQQHNTNRPVRQLAMHDLKTNSLSWMRETPIYDYSGFMYSKNYFFCSAAGVSICYNKKDGQERWRCSTTLLLVNDSAGVAVSVTGAGYDLKTGRQRWDRRFLLNDWRNHLHINSRTIAVLGSTGLEYIHLTDGSGWTFDGDSGHSSLPEFKGYTSNLLFANYKIYFATERHMFCVDTAGAIVWQRDLPGEKGRSFLAFNKDSSMVTLVGYGTNRMGYRAGAAYITAWHAHSGKPLYLQMIPGRDVVKSWYIDSVANILAGATHIYAYDINSGQQMAAVKTKGVFSDYSVLLNRAYNLVSTDSMNFSDEWETFPAHSFWFNPHDSTILRADQNLRPAETLPLSKWWALYKHTPDFDLVWKYNKMVLVRQNKRFATLGISNATLAGNKLVSFAKNHFYVIDMAGWF